MFDTLLAPMHVYLCVAAFTVLREQKSLSFHTFFLISQISYFAD